MSLTIDSFLNFLINNKWIILFYLGIILLIYFNRKKFEIQARVIAMYRTKFGINKIHSFAKKHSEIIKLVGYIGIGVGFIILLIISGSLIYWFIKLFTTPDAPAALTPVIPGVKIPGSPIFFPFWYTIIALFIAVIVHEFSHGIVAAAHGLKVKSTGIVFFGPLIGAFVEPDEKEIKKKSDVVQYSIFAAGPFSNLILGGIAFLIMAFMFAPIHGALTNEVGVTFSAVQNDTPAQKYGLYQNMTIIGVNNVNITSIEEFNSFLSTTKPNETIIIHSNKSENFTLITAKHPDNPNRGYLGVVGVRTVTELKNDNLFYKITDKTALIFFELFFWIYLISIGLGVGNLLPLGPVDGGRMLQVSAIKTTGNEKKGTNLWIKISLVTVAIVLMLLFVPIFRAVFKF